MCLDLLKDSIFEKVEANQLETRAENKMWLGRHLEGIPSGGHRDAPTWPPRGGGGPRTALPREVDAGTLPPEGEILAANRRTSPAKAATSERRRSDVGAPRKSGPLPTLGRGALGPRDRRAARAGPP